MVRPPTALVRPRWRLPYLAFGQEVHRGGKSVQTVQVPGAVRLALPRQRGRNFLVVKRRFRMEFGDRHVWLEEGEFLIVPRGVAHRPVAEEEADVLLVGPAE